jgi:methanogenic corrinoid protein MtbC1
LSDSGNDREGAAKAELETVRLDPGELPYHAVRSLADEVVVRLAGKMRSSQGQALAQIEVDIHAFTAALLSDTPDDAHEMIRQERREGVPIETIYLHTLAGSAKLMGKMWEEDRLSFLSMTVAVGHIFSIMRGLRYEIPLAQRARVERHRALFISVPGETHTIGITMAADLLRNKGWDISLKTGRSHDDLVSAIQGEYHELIGISASQPTSIGPLTRLVVALRFVQPHAHIVIGGQIVSHLPELNSLIAADAVIDDGDDVEALLDSLSELPPRDRA